MPGVERMTIDALLRYIEQVIDAGIQCIALFPCVMPERVTNDCQEAWNPDNLICRAIREVKKHYPAIGIIERNTLNTSINNLLNITQQSINSHAFYTWHALCCGTFVTDSLHNKDRLNKIVRS
jgi:hypothetical protein